MSKEMMSVMMRKGRELRMLELMLGPRVRFDYLREKGGRRYAWNRLHGQTSFCFPLLLLRLVTVSEAGTCSLSTHSHSRLDLRWALVKSINQSINTLPSSLTIHKSPHTLSLFLGVNHTRNPPLFFPNPIIR